MAEFVKQTFHKGEVLCSEGIFESWMYEIVKGQVAVYKEYGTEAEKKLATITEGYVGEMGVIDSLPRTATVVAEEETEVIVIGVETFKTYFEENPEKIKDIMVILTKRLAEIDEMYQEACIAIRDYLKANDDDKTLSEELKAAMKKFSKIFRKRAMIVAACVALSAAAASGSVMMASANSGTGIEAMQGASIQNVDRIMYVQTDCNVRESGSTSSRILNSYPAGTKVNVIGILLQNGMDTGWREVITRDQDFGGECSGFIAASLLGYDKPSGGGGTVSTYETKYVGSSLGANVRASSSTDSAVVGSASYGENVVVTGYTSNGWCKVTTGGGVTGYIRSDLLTNTRPSGGGGNNGGGGSSNSGIKENKNYAYKSMYTVNVASGYLALRSSKSYNSGNEIKALYNGQKVEVLEGNGTYWTVRLPGTNIVGYVNSNYLY